MPNMNNKDVDTLSRKLIPVLWKDVKIQDGFWGRRQEINRTVTLQAEYEQLEKTGRIDSLKLEWEPGKPNKPHHYWDSDLAKWIEAVAYSLALHPDSDTEEKIDEIIDAIAKVQQEDGYFNTYYTVVEPGKRWTDVYDKHELYCAGHLTESAIAYYESTGKRKFLDIMCRYIDYIDTVFGEEEGKIKGYPGHQELELALIKLYRLTGEKRYLKLSKYFIDERGCQPYFFELEAIQRGDNPEKSPKKDLLDKNFLAAGSYALFQSHLPVREQTTAEGHAVRAMYLYSGMADVAVETSDKSLIDTCECLWKNVTERRMYITGGIGPLEHGECFSFDYDLPNETAYNETCAAIGLVFWAHRMLQIDGDGKYADIMEQALYNGVISGVSLTGDSFFYANHLATHPETYTNKVNRNPRMLPNRQKWFEVSCCPPNLARLTASLGQYIYSQNSDEAYVHLYIQGSTEYVFDNKKVNLTQITNYPWDETVNITVSSNEEVEFTLVLRIPGWCRESQVKVNDSIVQTSNIFDKGYIKINRVWNPGDVVELTLPMNVERIEAHPSVRMDCGRVTLKRGPLVYCLEEIDNEKNLNDIILPKDVELQATFKPDVLGGIVVINGTAKRRDESSWEGYLYRPLGSETRTVELTAIPYYAWSNRKVGEMIVWIRQE